MNAKQNVLLICLTILTILRFSGQAIVVKADDVSNNQVFRLVGGG